MVIGVEIPGELLYGVLPIVLAGVMSLLAYLVRMASKNETGLGAANTSIDGLQRMVDKHDDRIRDLERGR